MQTLKMVTGYCIDRLLHCCRETLADYSWDPSNFMPATHYSTHTYIHTDTHMHTHTTHTCMHTIHVRGRIHTTQAHTTYTHYTRMHTTQIHTDIKDNKIMYIEVLSETLVKTIRKLFFNLLLQLSYIRSVNKRVVKVSGFVLPAS